MLGRDACDGRLLVYHQTDPARFSAQLGDIRRHFEFVDLDAAVARTRREPPTVGRSPFVAVTFDDGFADFLGVMDHLVSLGVPACLYITRDYLGRPGYLNEGEVRSISETFDIGSHTISHPKLLGLEQPRLAQELEGSRHYLEDLIGKPVVHFAAPYGGPSSFDPIAIRMAAEAGYKTFRTTFRGWNTPDPRSQGAVRLLRADVVQDWYPPWRLRLVLAGAMDWRAGFRLRRQLQGTA